MRQTNSIENAARIARIWTSTPMEDEVVLHNIWNSIRLGRRRARRNPRAESLPFDPLSHPAIRRMSPRELADLPLGVAQAATPVDCRR